MSKRNFRELLEARWAEGKFVCVGLDPDPEKIPKHLMDASISDTLYAFCMPIVDATCEAACVYKPNIAFFERFGARGLDALFRIIESLHRDFPPIPVILDAKRGDIGNTNHGYVAMAFEWLDADAITVHPYMGQESLAPFLARGDKGIFVLCRTSNPGAEEFQDRQVVLDSVEIDRGLHSHWICGGDSSIKRGPLYLVVAHSVRHRWQANATLGLVVGATYPGELAAVRGIVGDMPILIPGVGAQGGDLEASVKAGKDSKGTGFLINSSSGIIHASTGSDFAEAAGQAAKKLHDEITAANADGK